MAWSGRNRGTRRARLVLLCASLVMVVVGGGQVALRGGGAAVAAPLPVRVAQAATGDLKADVALSGELRAVDQLDVMTRVGSRVIRVPVTVGQVVAQGDPLVVMDALQQEVSLAGARSSLAKERANFAKVENGAANDDFSAAALRLRQAYARYAAILKGVNPDEAEQARQRVASAKAARERAVSSLANAKEQARLAVDQATADLKRAQALYGAAKLVFDEAERTGRDPNVTCPDTNKKCNELSDIKLRGYKADYESKEQGMRAAETTLEAKTLAYEDALRQEAAGVIQEEAKLADAVAAYQYTVAGSDPGTLGSVTAEFEAAKAGYQVAAGANPTPEYQAARLALVSAEQAVRQAEAGLAEAVVRAPFAGTVTQRYVSVGSVVSASTAVVQVVSTALEARLLADDSQVVLMKAGQTAELKVGAYPGVAFKATVSAVSPSASATSRTFTVTVTPDQADARLLPGMLVEGSIAAVNRTGVLMVPEEAVLTRGLESVVFVVVDGKARRRPVTTGTHGGGQVEIISGVSAGDSVVVQGHGTLNDNDQVTIVN